jgi:hypothetical protein
MTAGNYIWFWRLSQIRFSFFLRYEIISSPFKNKKCAYRSKRTKTQTPIVAKPINAKKYNLLHKAEFAFYQILSLCNQKTDILFLTENYTEFAYLIGLALNIIAHFCRFVNRFT